jgi:hypothetical protein
MNYKFYNDFIDQWRMLPLREYNNPLPLSPYHLLSGWYNPNPSLLNSQVPLDYSLNYIPEPWWGNAGQDELHAVVINYNPGSGGLMQSIRNHHLRSLYGAKNYQEFVNEEVENYVRYGSSYTKFSKTNDWHYRKRAVPIFNALTASGIVMSFITAGCVNNAFYKSYLSIELIPWHTRDISTINNYVNTNLIAVKNILEFAADRSRSINNNKLKSQVLVKMAGNSFDNLLKRMSKSGVINGYTNTSNSSTKLSFPAMNAKYSSYSIKDIPGVIFTCIWMPYSFKDRMGLPAQADLNWIFQNVI